MLPKWIERQVRRMKNSGFFSKDDTFLSAPLSPLKTTPTIFGHEILLTGHESCLYRLGEFLLTLCTLNLSSM